MHPVPRARDALELCSRKMLHNSRPVVVAQVGITLAARRTGLSTDAVIAAHLAGDYRVFLYGFAPGYAYMGGLPEAIKLDRKTTPVRGVPAGQIIIAGTMCLITTLVMPTGWWIIGRTPTRVLTGDEARPFLFDVGDHIQFHRVSQAEFEALP